MEVREWQRITQIRQADQYSSLRCIEDVLVMILSWANGSDDGEQTLCSILLLFIKPGRVQLPTPQPTPTGWVAFHRNYHVALQYAGVQA